MSRLVLMSSVLLVVAACGEDENLLPTVDGAPSIDAPPPIDAPIVVPMPTALFVAGDFGTTGIFTKVDVAARTVQTNAIAGVAGGDPAIRRFGDEVFIVNRSGGSNITILGGSPLALVDQFSTGAGSNPQDVAAIGDKLYVSAYETAGVVVVNRTTRQLTTIALGGVSAANDTDGVPDCASVFLVGTRLYVSCQRFDRSGFPWVTRGPGRVVVINTTDDTVESAFSLGTIDEPLANPAGLFQATPTTGVFGGDLLLPVSPSFSDVSTGCLARVRTTGTPGFNGCAATNMAMNGYVNRVAISSDGTKAWLAVFRYQNNPFAEFGHLRSLDLMTGAVGDAVSPGTQTIVDVAACPGGYVVATDSAGATAGLRIWHDGTETTTTPLDLGRVPNQSNSLACY